MKIYEMPTRQLYKVKLGGLEKTDEIVERLKEKRGFDYVNGLITQVNFPLRPHEIEYVEMEIIDPGRSFTEDEGLSFLNAAGLEPPTEEHAIRFTEQCGTMTIGEKPYVIFLHKPRLDWDLDPKILYLDRRPGHLWFSLFSFGNWFFFNENHVIAGVRRL